VSSVLACVIYLSYTELEQVIVLECQSLLKISHVSLHEPEERSSLACRTQHFSNCTCLVGQVLGGTVQLGFIWNVVEDGRVTSVLQLAFCSLVFVHTRLQTVASKTIHSG
jgi:hypothetical protein